VNISPSEEKRSAHGKYHAAASYGQVKGGSATAALGLHYPKASRLRVAASIVCRDTKGHVIYERRVVGNLRGKLGEPLK
jgi:hypothetical protein